MTQSTPSRPEKARAWASSGPPPTACVASAPRSVARAKRRPLRLTTRKRPPGPRPPCTARPDAAHDLVPHPPRVGHGPVARPDPIVGPAEPGHGDADEDLVPPDLGSRRRFDAQIARAVKNRGFHAGECTPLPGFF